MQFAYPPRKTSHPPPYAIRNSRSLSFTQRRQLQFAAVITCIAFLLILLLSRAFSSSEERIPPGTSQVVIVTLLDEENLSAGYMEKIKKNRKDYAARHGTHSLPSSAYILPTHPTSSKSPSEQC